MLTAQSKARPHPDAVFTSLQDGNAILLHLLTRHYFTLNETGACIWQWLSEGMTLGEVAQALESRYDVGPQQAQQSVVELVERLVAEQLVLVTDEQEAEMTST